MGTVAAIIAVPYSCDKKSFTELSKKYKVFYKTLEDLLNPELLMQLIKNNLDPLIPTIFLEIGGYFSTILRPLKSLFKHNLLGIIEDTEFGHRQYESLKFELPCPVISVARSNLKNAENNLIGNSCLFATELIFRQSHLMLRGRRSLVIGYGKVGKSIAHALKAINNPVFIYDIDPVKRVHALSEGFFIPKKEIALNQAEIIFSATGKISLEHTDFHAINDACVLVSCSSRNVEFDINSIKNDYEIIFIDNNLIKYKNKINEKHLYVIGDGKPVNFVQEKILVGPLIFLVQAEMIQAAIYLSTKKDIPHHLFELNDEEKKVLAHNWINYFCNSKTGYYHHD